MPGISRNRIIIPSILFLFSILEEFPLLAQAPIDSQEVPILCYHNIRPSLAEHLPALTISTETFEGQMEMLNKRGFTCILPEQLFNHFTNSANIPVKPVMITFDDSREEQYTLAKPILDRYHLKGVFFVMTVTIGKPGYLSAAQIKELADSGHCIALHTWDHPDMRKMSSGDWSHEIDAPRKLLERITGKPVDYFAYPYGAWNEESARQLELRGFKAAFQLSGKRSATHPLYTIRRLQVSGLWSAATLASEIRSAFH